MAEPTPSTEKLPKITLEELISWSETLQGSDIQISENNENKQLPSKFPFNHSLNQKIILWKGEIVRLDADCLVSPNNESLSEVGGLSERIFRASGPELLTEIETLEGCRTAEAKITSGYNLYARHIIHTVGPKYHAKYKIAAENALHSSYLNALQLIRERKLTSIAFPPIHSEKRGYPPQEAVHIALRTIRRFLEKFGEGIKRIILCFEDSNYYQIYEKALPLYFPRSDLEELAVRSLLPEDVGNELGETVVPERQIRINAFPFPFHSRENDSEEEEEQEQDEKLAVSKLTTIEESPDTLRKVVTTEPVSQELEDTYRQLLGKLRNTDISYLGKMKIVYPGGVTQKGDQILVVVGKLFASKNLNMDHLLLYLIKTMELLASKSYIIVYLHYDVSEVPEFNWQKLVYSIFEFRYCSKMKQCFVVHPTFMLKVYLTVMAPFLSSNFRSKLQYTDLKGLFQSIDRNCITLPPEVFHYDHRETGNNWFTSPSPMNPHDNL